MDKNNKDNENGQNNNYNGKTYAYIAVALIIAGAAAIGLTFTVLGIYSLIAAVLLSLASLSFTNIQKRKNNFKQLIFIKVCAYVVLAASVAFFVCGLIWSAIS